MIAASQDITSLIPHRDPFIMISTLISASETEIKTEFKVEATNIFVRNGLLQEGALIENIAQSCAAGFGYLSALSGVTPKMGFLGGITRVRVHALPPVNSIVQTIVVITHRIENVYMAHGRTFLASGDLLECDLKIAVK